MNLINKSHLKHPRLLTGCILILGLLGCFNTTNALLHAGTFRDIFYTSIPLLFTVMLYTHFRYPTKFGWIVISLLLLTPSIAGIVIGSISIYLDIGSKYSWTVLVDFLLINIAVLLVIALILYSAKITEIKP